MGRMFSVPIVAVAVSAVQDLFEITAPSGAGLILRELIIGQSSDFGDAQAEILGIAIKRGAGHTPGSSGSAVTPVPFVSGLTAAATAARNNTTQAVAGSGTLTTVIADTFNEQTGYRRIVDLTLRPSEAAIVSVTVPADAIMLSATAIFEELGS